MAVYLLGGHQTDFSRVWSREGLDISDILREGVLGALEACALDASDIDAVHVGNAFGGCCQSSANRSLHDAVRSLKLAA